MADDYKAKGKIHTKRTGKTPAKDKRQPKGGVGKAKKALSGRAAQLKKQMDDLGI
jgi:hypothetical protein